MNLPTTLRSGIHLRFLISLALTAAIVAPFLLLGRASAVTLELDCPEATVQRGDEFFCDMTLTFRENLSIQELEFLATGPTSIQANFLLFGKLKSKSPQIKDVILLSQTDNGYNYGYSYGYGYGYGYGYDVGPSQFKYRVIIDSTNMDAGDYQARFALFTDDTNVPAFESNTDTFRIVDVGPTTSEVDGRVLLQARGADNHAGTELILFRDGVQQGPPVVTSSDGGYMFDLEPGNYELRATHSGWLPETISFVVGTSGNPVDLGDAQLDAGDADADEDIDSDDMRLFQSGLNQPPRPGIFTDPDDNNMTTVQDMAYGAKNFGKPASEDESSDD